MKEIIRQLKKIIDLDNNQSIDDVYEEIWDQYYKRIYYYVSSIISVRNHNIDDMVQEIMLKVYEKFSTYSDKYALSTWIYTIARNHCYDFLRKDKGDQILTTYDPEKSDENPAETVIRLELKNKIKTVLNCLPENEREIIYLSFYENMTYKQISIITGIPVGTIKYKMSLLKQKLKNELKEFL